MRRYIYNYIQLKTTYNCCNVHIHCIICYLNNIIIIQIAGRMKKIFSLYSLPVSSRVSWLNSCFLKKYFSTSILHLPFLRYTMRDKVML